MVWTGSTASAPNKYPIYDNKKKFSIRRYIWEHEYGTIPVSHRLFMKCGDTLCINVKHMEKLAPGEVVRGDSIVQFDADDYIFLPCDICAKPCKVRGKFPKGASRAFNMPDGSRICGTCHRKPGMRQLAIDNSPHTVYAGTTDDLIEDVTWLLEADESGTGVARRLGFDSEESLFKVLKKIDREDLVVRFLRQGVVNSVTPSDGRLTSERHTASTLTSGRYSS